MGDSVLGVLGRTRALALLDYLDRRGTAVRFKEIQKDVANGVPSVATGLLSSLGRCGAIARDDSTGIPRYLLTDGGRVARKCLHQVTDALEMELKSGGRQGGVGSGRRLSRHRSGGPSR